MFNDHRVKDYFDKLNLSAEQRDELAESLCQLFPREQWGPKRAVKAASTTETARVKSILEMLDELDCLLSTGLTTKQYNSNKVLPMTTGRNITTALIKFEGFTPPQAAEAEENLSRWIAALPNIIGYFSAAAKLVATDDWINREVEQSLSVQQLYGDSLKDIYERFLGRPATITNSQATDYTIFAEKCSILFKRAIDPKSISKQGGNKRN